MPGYAASRNFGSSSRNRGSNRSSKIRDDPEAIFETEIGVKGYNYTRGDDRTDNNKKICLFNEKNCFIHIIVESHLILFDSKLKFIKFNA